MPRSLSALLLAAAPMLHAQSTHAQDVHVRVEPGAPASTPDKPGADQVFPTIQNALDHHPFAGPGGRVLIEIAPGTYHERIIVTQNHQNVTLLGMGAKPEDTVITNSLNAKTAGGTFFTETAEINGDGFQAANLTIENSAGNTGQAVAAAVRADRAVFRHVRFLGHQDTLFADHGRQLYLECFITGGVDYIFGNATAVFDRSTLVSNGPGFVTAQSRTAADQTTGYVILHSRVETAFEQAAPLPEGAPGARREAMANRSIGLGRPWRPYSRVVYLQDELPATLSPAGWNNWGKPSNEQTAYYAEYRNTGPGAISGSGPGARVAWAHQLTAAEAEQYQPGRFLAGADGWDAEAAATKLP